MSCHRSMPAPGSAASFDALTQSFIQWRLRQSASDLMWTNADEADAAHKARGALLCHAVNCGFDPEGHSDLIKWAAQRVNAWGQTVGIPAFQIAVALGEFADGAAQVGAS